MRSLEIDRIARVCNEGPPHIGAETEGIITNAKDLSVVHEIDGEQPTEAVRQWLKGKLRFADANLLLASITPDVPETTIEANPPPMHSPIASAASQRLMAIIIDMALEQMSDGDFHAVHGASLRPTNTTEEDASKHVSLWKQVYYKYQIGVHGDKMAAAAGDHLNLSAPWGDKNSREVSRKMIEMTARMRLIAAALSIGLSASSPLHYFANGGQEEPTFGTALTQFESARLGQVWPGRTVMDVPGLYESPAQFEKIMATFAQLGILKSGRDVWLPVRAQPGETRRIKSFEEACLSIGLSLDNPEHRELATKFLHASFEHGPDNRHEHSEDQGWRAIEEWRQRMLVSNVEAPRNRVEIRTLETPPAFDGQTPYEYIKALQNFLDLLFIYLSGNPDFAANLEYDAINLQAAKHNENAVLNGGMDVDVYWIPNMRTTTSRDLLGFLLGKVKDLANGLGRTEDLRIIEEIVKGGLKTPAQRIREEVGHWYGINIDNRNNARLLKDDSYPQDMLERTRAARAQELVQIRADLGRMPAADRPYVESLLSMVGELSVEKSDIAAEAASASPT